MGVFKDAPIHDWSSHSSDACRALAMGLRETQPKGLTPAGVTPVRLSDGRGNASWMGS
jgi:hypothetical protein